MQTKTEKMDEPLTLPESLLELFPTSGPFDCQSLLSHTKETLSTPIFNHSVRVFLLATQILQQQPEPGTIEFTNPSQVPRQYTIKPHLLFAASIFHDMGTCPSCNGPQRFAVEGADAAVRYLRSLNFQDSGALNQVWTAIALHTSAGIAERIDPLTWLVRMAVKADLSPTVREILGLNDFSAEIEHYLPRLEIEVSLADAVVAQATRGEMVQGLYVTGEDGKWTDSAKFPKASWPGVLLRGKMEKVRDEGKDWQGANPAF